jgi:hypothetical protein
MSTFQGSGIARIANVLWSSFPTQQRPSNQGPPLRGRKRAARTAKQRNGARAGGAGREGLELSASEENKLCPATGANGTATPFGNFD